MYYRFRGVTGKHGVSISRRLRAELKAMLARKRRKRKKTTRPKHTGRWHGAGYTRRGQTSKSWR